MRLGDLQSHLATHLLGQEEAVAEFAAAVARAEAGPPRPGRPKSFLLLLGPTGTGKTEMTKLTARFLYGTASDQRFARFDLGEFQHRDAVVRLLGGPGQPALLGAAVNHLAQAGGGILLLDEVEKAHPDLLTLLLSFDDARTTMADGTTRDLSLCHIWLTSNLGAAEAAQMVHNGYSSICRKVRLEAERALRKETVARFSAVIVMNALRFTTQLEITRRLLSTELERHSRHCGRPITTSGDEVVLFLTAKGYTRDLGARPLRGAVERWVGDAMLAWVEAATPPPHSTSPLEIAVEDDRLIVRRFDFRPAGNSLRSAACCAQPSFLVSSACPA